jgi:hypothetical protein
MTARQGPMRQRGIMSNGSAMVVNARIPRVATILVGAGLVLAACGGGSSGGGATAAPASSGIAPTGAATAAGSGGSVSGSSFCTLAKAEQSQEAKEVKTLQSDTPAQLGAYVQSALGELQLLASSAPSAIKSDVQTVVTADETVFQALKKANYNYQNLSPTTLESVDTPAFKRAGTAVTSYLETTCGVSPAATATG